MAYESHVLLTSQFCTIRHASHAESYLAPLLGSLATRSRAVDVPLRLVEVRLVPDEHDDHVRVRVLPRLVQPPACRATTVNRGGRMEQSLLQTCG